MALPDANRELTNVQFEYYKSVGKAARLWYTLTVIKLILGVLTVVGLCVGAILSTGSLTLLYQELMQGISVNGY